ncbi:MAG: PKD domain-containing protein [Flavobacteriales bacterium]
MSKLYKYFSILTLLFAVSFSAQGQSVTVVSGSPQNPDVVSSFALTLSDPTGFSQECLNDGYGNYNCYNNYTITIAQGGYNYYSGSAGILFGSNTITSTMSELQSVPNNSVFNVTVTDSWPQGEYGIIAGPWSCTDCFRTSNLAVTTSGVDVSCGSLGSATASVSGGIPPYTYSWTGGGSTSSIDIATPGTYTVAVTDGNNVTVNESVIVGGTANLAVTATGSDIDDLCDGGTVSVVVNSGTPSYSYLWSDGSTTSSVSGLDPGTYTVEVTDGNCVQSASATVAYVPTLVVESGSTQSANTTSFALELSDPTGGLFDYTSDGYDVTTDYGIQITDCAGTVYYNDDVFPGTMPAPWDGMLNLTMDQMVVPPAGASLDVRVREWNSNTYWICSGCFHTLPANDECSGAIALTQGATCSPTTGSLENATQSAAGCSGGAGANDVWFVFTATAESATVDVNGSADVDAVFEFYEATDCASLPAFGICVDNGFFAGDPESAQFDNLTVGGTYYIRVHHYGGGIPVDPSFDICVYALPQPANDVACGAIAVTNDGVANGPYDHDGNTAEVWEADAVPAGTSCTSQDGWCAADPGVENSAWYTFVAPASGNVTVSSTGTNFDTQLAVFAAANCQDVESGTSVTLLAANDDDPAGGLTSYVILCGLNPGETYYVMLDGYNAASDDEAFITVTEATVEADFTYAATGLSVAFTDASSGAVAYAWDFGDGNVSTDASPTHVYGADGPYTVCLTVTDANGCTSEYCEAIQVADIATTIAEAVERGMEVYPNPSNGQFVLTVRGVEADVEIVVMDVAGRQVYNEGATLNNSFRKELTLDVAKGTYLLQIATMEGLVTRKIQVH